MISLVIYEDNDKLRKTLGLLLSNLPDIALAGAFPHCRDAARQVNLLQPDVVLMDIDMPGRDGIEGVRVVKETLARCAVLMHTVFDDDQKIFNSLAAGADGYMLKSATPAQICDAIRDVRNGGTPLSPGIAKKVLESFRRNNDERDREMVDLSEREREILLMLTKGFTYKRISMECGITIDTTRTHIKNIYAKLHVNCSNEAVAKAIRMKLFS